MNVRGFLDSTLQDMRFGVRTLLRKPGFTATAVLTLGLGVGTSATLFSVVNGVLLKPLPYEDHAQLVYLGRTWGDQEPTATSVPDFMDWQNRLTTPQGLAAAQSAAFVLTEGGEPERIHASRVSAQFFSTLGVSAMMGRTLSNVDSDAANAAVLSYGIWRRRWGADPGAIGTTITMTDENSGETRTFNVIGVMPVDFRVPAVLNGATEGPEIWVSLPLDPSAYAASRTSYNVQVVGRLPVDVALEAARQEVNVLAEAMAEEFPDAYTLGGNTLGIGVTPLLERTVGGTRTGLLLLFGATAILLLVGCANVANLLLARATSRIREIAVRSSLGAGRFRILRQLLSESLLLGALGGGVGVVVAFAGVSALRALGPSDLPRLAEIGVDGRVLGFSLGIAVLTGMLVGIAPALRGSKAAVSASLREGGTGATIGKHDSRLRGLLVVTQTALALVLTVGAGLLINSYVRLSHVDSGIDADDLRFMEVRLPRDYGQAERVAFFSALAERVQELPGVRSAGLIGGLPLGTIRSGLPIGPEGAQESEMALTATHLVGSGYFETARMRLLRGRGFVSTDDAGGSAVAIVNETLARRLWPDANPIGKRLIRSPGSDGPFFTVVGVVNDVHQRSLSSAPLPQLYIPYPQFAMTRNMYVVARTAVDMATIVDQMRQTLWELDPSLPVADVGTMNARISESLREPRFQTALLGFFAAVALLLAAAGIYATTTYAIGQRTYEMGIRIALGAKPGGVMRLVLRQTSALLTIAIAVGILGSVVLSRVLGTFVFGITTTDPLTILCVSAFLGSVALVACYIPARRATRIDPLEALRAD